MIVLSDHRNADLSANDLACLQFCLKLARHAPSVSSEDIETLRACGFGDEAIFEAVVVTALAIYRCTLSVGLGPEPDSGPRKLTSDENCFAAWGSASQPLPDAHARRHEEKAICTSTIPQSEDVCTLCCRSEESRIYTQLFSRSDFAARLAGSRTGSNGQDSAT